MYQALWASVHVQFSLPKVETDVYVKNLPAKSLVWG